MANLAGLAVLPVVIAFTARRSRTLALGAGWMLTLLLPALLFPLMTYMAERYLYAASLGFCWCLAEGIIRLGSRGREARCALGVASALAAILILGFSYRTVTYNRIWSNPDAFWSYAIERSEDRRVHNNLAQVRVSQKRFAEAERLYEQALEVENYVSYQGLATVYYAAQRRTEAERAIDRALAIAGQQGADGHALAEIEYTRGAISWAQEKHQRAIEAWESGFYARESAS